MKIAFISNYLTPHQAPFCETMVKQLGDDFSFIASMKMEEERKNMGWGLKLQGLSYFHEYDEDPEKAENLLMEADVAICGDAPYRLFEKRLKAGKPTLRYYERLFKKDLWRVVNPKTRMRYKAQHGVYKDAPVYLLCAGGYVPDDFAKFGAYKGKTIKWGYFPYFDKTPLAELMEMKQPGSILWTGRMLSWKHPEEAVYAMMLLKDHIEGIHLTMIGEGEQRPLVEKLIKEHGLEDCVTLLPFMKPKEVREYMKRSEIYLMTSDRQEGWGAVMNEAMNSGCAVVASHMAGATPYLIPDDGLNGYVYSSREIGELTNAIYDLLLEGDKRKNMAERAYESIAAYWNAEEASLRMIDFCEGLLKGEERYYSGGPMSRAENLKMTKRFEGMWVEKE
ncbi:MAG: glycosyltransferase family 4 protein [Lachnospiraceae bacterium]|nr:glycosyltransferase family 4 protein [Lachnospiraceae bacterium]